MVNSPVVFRNLCHSWSALVLKMSLGANFRGRMFRWMNWGLTQVLLAMLSSLLIDPEKYKPAS